MRSKLHHLSSLAPSASFAWLHVERVDERTSAVAVAGTCGLDRLPALTRTLRDLTLVDDRVVVDLSDCPEPDASLLSAVRSQRHLSGGDAAVALVAAIEGAHGTRAAALDALGANDECRWRIVSERLGPRTGRVVLSGEWDLANVRHLQAALLSATERGRLEIEVRLRRGAFIDVLALHALADTALLLERRGGRLTAAPADGPGRHVLELAERASAGTPTPLRLRVR